MRKFLGPLWRDIQAVRGTNDSTPTAGSVTYTEASGSEVFVIHGYRGSLNDYTALSRALTSTGVRVHGVSYSAEQPIAHGHEQLAWALAQVPSGIRVCLVGHSLGGVLAARAALENPERVSGVVAISAPLRGTSWARLPLSSVPGLDVLRPGSPYLHPIGLLGTPRQPLLCLSGTGDAVARPKRALCTPGPGRTSVLLTEGHHSILANSEAHREVCDFVHALKPARANVL